MKPINYKTIVRAVFNSKLYFSIVFFTVLFLDIFVKLNFDAVPYRLITKPLVILSLLCFFLINNKTELKKRFVIIALISFLIGDLLLIFNSVTAFYLCGIAFFCYR